MELNNVICETPEQFHEECKKWAGKGVIRGRKLIAYGETVAELVTSGRGGYRKGAGRKESGRDIPLMVRISREAADKLNSITGNKSEFIDNMIKSM